MRVVRSILYPTLVAGLGAVLAPASGATLGAQREISRPRLERGADTNDARAYYDRGVTLFDREPGTAGAAFYWASRLEPGWAEPLYARRLAGLMTNPRVLVGYLEGNRKIRESADVRRLDSLELRALRLNPFFARDLDKPFFLHYVIEWFDQEARRSGAPPLDLSQRMEVEFLLESAMRSIHVDPGLRAHLAESRQDYAEALGLYRVALRESRDRVGPHRDIAHLFYLTGAYDSALVHLQSALDELRGTESERLVMVYESKELLEHAIGVIAERRGDIAGAREAYGRALQENLSYYPGHVRLGLVSLATGDTAQALQELNLAIEVAPADALVRLNYGALLAQSGRLEDAVVQLRKATELEPYYALPYFVLGRVGEALHRRDQALQDYRAFLARASLGDPRRDEATRRVAELEALPPNQ